MRLDKDHTNPIVEAWKEAGLDPNDLELENYDDDDAETRISHRRFGSYFTIGGEYGHFVGSRAVGDGPGWPYEAYTWHAVMERIGRWVGEVRRDLETPDLWAELQREREMLGTAPAEAVENTPFTPDEQKQIAEQLRELREYAKKNHAMSENQTQALEARLNYLEEAVGRFRRQDWAVAARGILYGLIVDAILPEDATRDIALMLSRSVGHLFGHPFPELPGGT